MRNDYSLEVRLQALGRLLDARPRGMKDLCVIEAEGGFVVNMLEESASQSGSALVPTTVFVDTTEFQAAVRQVIENPRPQRQQGRRRGFFGLG